jgi:hypothetical protein
MGVGKFQAPLATKEHSSSEQFDACLIGELFAKHVKVGSTFFCH